MNQLVFLDNFVKLYGFKGLDDYDTEITTSDYKDSDKLLQNINGQMPQIKKLFKTSQFNLSRKDYKVDNVALSFSLLKKCLQQAQIPFEIRHTNKCNYLRLIPINNILVKYIDHKMNDIVHEMEKDEKKVNPKNIDYRKDILEKYPPLYHIDDKDYYKNESVALLHTLLKNPANSICGKQKIYIDLCNELKVQNDYVIKEIRIPRSADLVFNFSYKLCNNNHIIIDSNVIKSVWLIIGNQIITKDLSELSAFNNAFPIIRAPYQELKIVFFMDKNYLDILTLNKLYIKYYEAVLDGLPRNTLICCHYRYNDNVTFNGNFGTGNLSYITDNRLEYICQPNKNTVDFNVQRYHDLIYNFKISLINSHFEEFDEKPDFTEITFNGMNYYDIESFVEDSPLPLCNLQYTEIRLRVTTHIKDCFVKIEYSGKNITDEIKQRLSGTPFRFTENPIFGVHNNTLGCLNQSHIDKGWIRISELLEQ